MSPYNLDISVAPLLVRMRCVPEKQKSLISLYIIVHISFILKYYIVKTQGQTSCQNITFVSVTVFSTRGISSLVRNVADASTKAMP